MKNILIAVLFLGALWSCTNSQKKSLVHHSDDEIQLLKKITNADFRKFVETFAIGKFPWDVSETPFLSNEEVPANFRKISLEDYKKFINPLATDITGYYTGYAIFENEYIAIIYFYSYSSLSGGDNYHTTVNLLTFNFEGKLINQITLGESSTRVNPNAQRESQKMEGSIYADNTTTIKTNNYLEENPNGSGTPLSFLIKANGEIEIKNISESNTLTIEGKNISLLTEPSTGEEIKKLNEGDKSKIALQGLFEIIRGNADYWYRVEFQGKEGWVFGSQTSKKADLQPITANRVEGLWEAFKKYSKDQVEYKNSQLSESEKSDGYIFTFSESSTDSKAFTVAYKGEGPSTDDYSVAKIENDDICIFSQSDLQEGAAGFTNKWSTFIGIKKDGLYAMYPQGAFDGKLEKLFKINDNEYNIITCQNSGAGIAAFRSIYYNVFYIDIASITIQLVNSKIGQFEWVMGTEENASVGDLIEKGVNIDFTGENNTFRITKYRSKKMTEDLESVTPFDTIFNNYIWDNSLKKFIPY